MLLDISIFKYAEYLWICWTWAISIAVFEWIYIYIPLLYKLIEKNRLWKKKLPKITFEHLTNQSSCLPKQLVNFEAYFWNGCWGTGAQQKIKLNKKTSKTSAPLDDIVDQLLHKVFHKKCLGTHDIQDGWAPHGWWVAGNFWEQQKTVQKLAWLLAFNVLSDLCLYDFVHQRKHIREKITKYWQYWCVIHPFQLSDYLFEVRSTIFCWGSWVFLYPHTGDFDGNGQWVSYEGTQQYATNILKKLKEGVGLRHNLHTFLQVTGKSGIPKLANKLKLAVFII